MYEFLFFKDIRGEFCRLSFWVLSKFGKFLFSYCWSVFVRFVMVFVNIDGI